MRIAVGSDMRSEVVETLVRTLEASGHEVVRFGAILNGECHWSKTGTEVGQAVADRQCDQGIVFCWTGTGISIAANKVGGVRAALCADAATARGARQWNDANVLAMSLRLTSEAVALEILDAWLHTGPSDDPTDVRCIDFLKARD